MQVKMTRTSLGGYLPTSTGWYSFNLTDDVDKYDYILFYYKFYQNIIGNTLVTLYDLQNHASSDNFIRIVCQDGNSVTLYYSTKSKLYGAFTQYIDNRSIAVTGIRCELV